jgi:hypothetical protein
VIAYVTAGQTNQRLDDFCIAALFFFLMFVDDAAAWVINDALFIGHASHTGLGT